MCAFYFVFKDETAKTRYSFVAFFKYSSTLIFVFFIQKLSNAGSFKIVPNTVSFNLNTVTQIKVANKKVSCIHM